MAFVGRNPQWFERRMDELDRTLEIVENSQKIPALGEFLGVASHGGMGPEQQAIFDKTQVALLAIPGHAKYYRDKIESMRAEVLASVGKTEDELLEMRMADEEMADEWSYSRYCGMVAFPTLACMPSPETVAVPGHFLNDTEGRDGKNLIGNKIQYNANGRLTVNAEAAALAIRKLGIENPPVRPREGRLGEYLSEGETDAWKKWWNDINEGRRTYRFVGSPIEYGPDGPASHEAIERSRKNRKRDEERTEGIRKTSESETSAIASRNSKSSTVAGILASLVL